MTAEQGVLPIHLESLCTRCKGTKPASEFYPDKRRPSGLHAWCKPCTLAYNRDYCKRNRPRLAALARRNMIKRKYGITWQQRDQMIIDQGNRCAICGDEFTDSKTTHVDHCHATGKIRDILCYSCNTGLGSFKDSPVRLDAALEYLKRHHP